MILWGWNYTLLNFISKQWYFCQELSVEFFYSQFFFVWMMLETIDFKLFLPQTYLKFFNFIFEKLVFLLQMFKLLLFLIPVIFGINILLCIFLFLVAFLIDWDLSLFLWLVNFHIIWGRIWGEKLINNHRVRMLSFEMLFVNKLMERDQLDDLLIFTIFHRQLLRLKHFFHGWLLARRLYIWAVI